MRHTSQAPGATLEVTLNSKAARVKATCMLIHSAPTGRRPIVPLRCTSSMAGIDFVHCSQLLGRCGSLKFFLPGLIGHAVDSLAALILAHRDALGVSFFLEPVGQAVATEARPVHQVDVLNVGTTAQRLQVLFWFCRRSPYQFRPSMHDPERSCSNRR